MKSWVRYSVAVYVGLLMAGSLVPPEVDASARRFAHDAAMVRSHAAAGRYDATAARFFIFETRQTVTRADPTES